MTAILHIFFTVFLTSFLLDRAAEAAPSNDRNRRPNRLKNSVRNRTSSDENDSTRTTRRSEEKYMHSFHGGVGYRSTTQTSQLEDGEESDPYVSNELRVYLYYVYRIKDAFFLGPIVGMENETAGSGEDQSTRNELSPGLIGQYWFGEPNDTKIVPFIWGGFRFFNSATTSGESKSTSSGLTYGGGVGGYFMIERNIAVTPIFEYSMGNHSSTFGETTAKTAYSTMQVLLGLSLLK